MRENLDGRNIATYWLSVGSTVTNSLTHPYTGQCEAYFATAPVAPPLSDLLASLRVERLALLKIDCEGCEYRPLENGGELVWKKPM